MSAPATATWRALADRLFPLGHALDCDERFLHGTAEAGSETVAVFGTTEHAACGVEIALASARFVLDVLRDHPGRPIVMLIDTEGQRLRRRDELLGINAYMAHVSQCVQAARLRGHGTLALIYDQALSGGFIATGMMADAQIRVMNLPAMARITKLPLEKLQSLSRTSAAFAPGVENYLRMGAVTALWTENLAQALVEALQQVRGNRQDERARLGKARGGRTLASDIVAAVEAWKFPGARSRD
jgi:malonate decarboxylase gamma subunit